MARDLSPITKQSRREGAALHTKAHKIMVRRTAGPGQHGFNQRRKPSQYSVQLREKQKVKRFYGLLEKQFANLMTEANKTSGKSGEVLLQLLERRLDNVIYRGGFSTSRRGARQLVSHGHFQLNGKAINVPSARVNAGDVITLKPSSKKNTYFSQFDPKTGGEQPALSWLKANPKKFEITINGLPTREEAEANINEQLIVEYYSR